MIVSLDRYRLVMRDVPTASHQVTGALTDAQALIEEHLDRPLEYADAATETLTLWRLGDGRTRANPRRVPISSVPAGADYQIQDSATLVDVALDPVFAWADDYQRERLTTTVTFAGGWKARDDATATDQNRLPITLERAICAVARALLDSPPPGSRAGVTSATVGDVSVTYADGTAAGLLEDLVPGITERLCGRRYRPIL